MSYVDVNECSESNGGCSHTCINLPGSFQCRCPSGSTLAANKKTCTGTVYLWPSLQDKMFVHIYNKQNELGRKVTTAAWCYINLGMFIYSNLESVKKSFKIKRALKSRPVINCISILVLLLLSMMWLPFFLGATVNTNFRRGSIRGSTGSSGATSERPHPYYQRSWLSNSCNNRNGGCEDICKETYYGVRCSCKTGYSLASDFVSCKGLLKVIIVTFFIRLQTHGFDSCMIWLSDLLSW